MPGLYSHQRFCDLADAEVARLAGAIRGADPATPVPTCGRWRMDDLVQHIGHIHRWAAAMVAELSPTRHSREKVDLPLPPDPAIWADWLAEARTFLIPALRAADPDARMWAWGAPAPMAKHDDLEPLTEDERSSILDAVALLEAYSRGDRLAVAALLHATDDAAYLRRVAGVLAYLVSHHEGVDDPNTLAHHPPKLHASGDTQ